MHILLWSITKHGPPQAILVSDWPIFKNLLLWNRFAKLTETWQEASMECPLWILLISSRSVNKHGHHRQFLFLIGLYLKNLLLWNFPAKWTKTWLKASTCMEGCVLSERWVTQAQLTDLEGVVTLFYLEYFHQKGCICNSSILNGNSLLTSLC